MLNKYYSKNNKTFTYNDRSFGIFPKAPVGMVDNLLFSNRLYIDTVRRKKNNYSLLDI